MGPHQGSVEGKENLPRPAGHTPPNAPQDAIGLLGSQGTLLAHGQPVVHQHSQVPLHRAAKKRGRSLETLDLHSAVAGKSGIRFTLRQEIVTWDDLFFKVI